MAYEFDCPYCSYQMNKEDIKTIHEDDVVGEWDIRCINCNKELELVGEASIDYSAYKKEAEGG